jgi:hypothetical protein
LCFLVVSDAVDARRAADGFIAQADLGYVVMNDARASEDLRRFAIEIFGLRKVAQSDAFSLYVPAAVAR